MACSSIRSTIPGFSRSRSYFISCSRKPHLRCGSSAPVTLVLAAVGAWSLRLQRHSDWLFWAVSIGMSYAPWLSANTPIFGGTKHWLTAYPFLCLFAGLGFEKVVTALRDFKPRLAHPLL